MKKSRQYGRRATVAANATTPTTSAEHKLLLPQAYEGERGVAYLLGAVGVFAPTTVALFLIDRRAYLEMGWSQSLLVVGAVGGMVTALLMCGLVIQDVAERRKPVPADERQRLMRNTLVCGPVLAQLAGLTIALTSRMAFPSYAYIVLLIAAGFATTQGAWAFVMRVRQNLVGRSPLDSHAARPWPEREALGGRGVARVNRMPLTQQLAGSGNPRHRRLHRGAFAAAPADAPWCLPTIQAPS